MGHAPTVLAARRAERRRAAGTDASEAGGRVATMLASRRAPWPGAVPVDTSGSVQEAMASVRPALPTALWATGSATG